MELVQLSVEDKECIKELFRSVFTGEPWNDDWSDEEQLDNYIIDLIGNSNSLTLGYRNEEGLIALAMGHIRHWYSGTEYFIDELCVKTSLQGNGIGGQFVKDIDNYLLNRNIKAIFLLTDKNTPAYEFYKNHGFMEYVTNVSFTKWIQ